jgi:hypothetical protein
VTASSSQRPNRARASRRWPWGLTLLALLVAAAVTAEVVLGEPGVRGAWREGYGIAAATLLLVALLYAARRRAMATASRLRLGSAAGWLRLHVVGGSLFLVLVLLHAGPSLPRGALNWVLWVSSFLVVLTGLVGLGLQRWIPRVLASGLAVEVLYERIPELVAEIRRAAESLVERCDEPVRVLYRGQVAPLLVGPQHRAIYYLDITGGIHSRLKEFHHLRRFLHAGDREKLAELEQLFRTKLEIDAHYTLQRALRAWLYLHVPVSLVLGALVVLHVFQVTYY